MAITILSINCEFDMQQLDTSSITIDDFNIDIHLYIVYITI